MASSDVLPLFDAVARAGRATARDRCERTCGAPLEAAVRKGTGRMSCQGDRRTRCRGRNRKLHVLLSHLTPSQLGAKSLGSRNRFELAVPGLGGGIRTLEGPNGP
jgi:hypothetical protein